MGFSRRSQPSRAREQCAQREQAGFVRTQSASWCCSGQPSAASLAIPAFPAMSQAGRTWSASPPPAPPEHGCEDMPSKARGAHGQVRVEKETLSERVKVIEVERERLSSRLETLEDSISKKAADTITLETKNIELEHALASALERLKAADVQAQSQQEKILALEKSKGELGAEKLLLKAKVRDDCRQNVHHRPSHLRFTD